MAFGPEFVRGLRTTLNERLPWRVAKVEGGDDWVALKVSHDDRWLLISWGTGTGGCCMADGRSILALRKGAPARTPLAEALRSRFVKADIVAVRQLNRDRVLEFEVRRRVAAGTEVRYRLVLEATEPQGNLVLLDSARRIEELARHAAPERNPYRTLLPGHSYAPPPEFSGTVPEALDSLEPDELMNIAGLGRPLLRLIRDHWEERSPEAWLSAVREADSDLPLPCQRTGKGYLTRFSVPFPEAEPLGSDTLAAAERGVLFPLLERGRDRRLRQLDARLKRAVKARERHKDGLLKQLKDCAEAEVLRRKGELLLAHLGAVPERAESVVLTDWEGSRLEIALDPHLSPSRNADRYFKKYRKAKGDPEAIRQGIAELESAMEELAQQRDLLEAIDDPEGFEEAIRDIEEWLSPEKVHKIQKRSGKGKNALPPHLSFERGGLTVLVGLSARGNRFVTFKQAKSDDLWLHAHELPGAHVVIRGARGREELETEHRDVLEFAAALAAAHSKGKHAGSVPVDYTERRYVRSVPGTVALVTYTNPGTLRIEPANEQKAWISQ